MHQQQYRQPPQLSPAARPQYVQEERPAKLQPPQSQPLSQPRAQTPPPRQFLPSPQPEMSQLPPPRLARLPLAVDNMYDARTPTDQAASGGDEGGTCLVCVDMVGFSTLAFNSILAVLYALRYGFIDLCPWAFLPWLSTVYGLFCMPCHHSYELLCILLAYACCCPCMSILFGTAVMRGTRTLWAIA